MKTFDPQRYWDERLRASFGLHGVGCDDLGEAYNTWLYRVRRRVLCRTVRSLALNLSKMKVIDIGSGTGFYIERWKELEVRTVVGTDLTSVSVENLRKRFPDDEFYQVDMGEDAISIPGTGQYHVASAFDVLFHIVDDRRYEAAMRNIYGLLRPGGWFIFSDNFLHHGTERGFHQVSRSLHDITDILRRTGFSVVKRVPTFVLMNDPIDQSSRFWRLAWQIMLAPVHKVKLLGTIWGALLYPWELILTRFLREGPSTEIMVCRKSA